MKKPKGFGKFDALARKLVNVKPDALGSKPTVIAREEGHEWCAPRGCTKWPWCKKCLMIRRNDGKNGPCTGHAKLRL
jgi:hypothetical protein